MKHFNNHVLINFLINSFFKVRMYKAHSFHFSFPLLFWPFQPGFNKFSFENNRDGRNDLEQRHPVISGGNFNMDMEQQHLFLNCIPASL